jgi:hypothetical protein
MASDPLTPLDPESPAAPDSVEMPRPTPAPLVLALGLALLAAGVSFGTGFLVVGAVVVIAGISLWIAQLLPGAGHVHESLVELARRPGPVTGRPGRVERLGPGMPGYRLRLPQEVHPISAGVKGGIVGGVVMPVPALLWGWVSGHGPLYPVYLLAGIVLPGIGKMDLTQFHASLLLVAVIIHIILSVVFGLIYGVLLATLPDVPRPIAWGGLLMPLLWTGTCYALMGIVNPVLAQGVSWPWFIFSQFLYGAVAAVVVLRAQRLRPVTAGLCGGILGGLFMPVPALLWGLLNRHSLWYPVNLLAGMVLSDLGQQPPEVLEQFHANWFMSAVALHALLSVGFGIVYGLLLPKLPSIPGPVAWGGVVLPLLWTGISYSLMGVVNHVLQQQVDWPWFVISQFVFGVVAAVVVLCSETVPIPPAGHGPDRA